jgi:translocation and assembly module TamA
MEETPGNISSADINSLQVSPEFRGYIDFRDSLFFPVKGYKTSFEVFNKSTVYGTGSKFTQFENNFAFYVPLQYRLNFAGDLEPKDTIIFHSFIETAFLILHEGELTSDDVLKLGGSTSIRGFFNNEMIPIDNEGGPSQGKYYMFIRNELRFKLFESMYLITFLDFGNLWEDIEKIGSNDLFRYTSGGGFTYLTPIGAVTAQIGFNLRPQSYQDTKLNDGDDSWTDGVWAFHIFIATF